MPNNVKILIVGSGYMASEYLKVLTGLGLDITVIGRGNENVLKLRDSFTEVKFNTGGLGRYLEDYSINEFTHIFNLVGIENLFETNNLLLERKVQRLLVEKPGALNVKQLEELKAKSDGHCDEFLIAYNRRFYDSVENLIKQAGKDGGIKNLHFEFTEWIHTINEINYDKETLANWIICNSSHVLDTAFYLIGLPEEIKSYVMGENLIAWHKSGSVFVGSGVSTQKIPFSYNCNWNSAGRWSIEVTTNQRRFYLSPMEKLRVQNKGKMEIIELDNKQTDSEYGKRDRYKDGLFNVIDCFIRGEYEKFVSLDEQIRNISVYNKIGGYDIINNDEIIGDIK